MKKVLLLIAFATASLPFANAGTLAITAANYNESTETQRPISSVAGTGISSGGIVAIGSWDADPAPLFAELRATPSATLWNTIVDNFLSYGSTTTLGNAAPFLYEAIAQEARDPGNPLDGKTIYTLIGNAATLRDSTEAALVTNGGTFTFAAPVADARADISAAAATILFGIPGGPNVETLLGSAPSLRLEATIPEPVSATLLFAGLALVFRRRR